MNYAAYVSATSIGIESVDSERHVGGRMGFFFPGPRLEVGGSWQKTLQDDRKNAFGFHMGWQPAKVPESALRIRPFVSGQWILDRGCVPAQPGSFLAEGDAPYRSCRARMQQFYVGEIGPDDAAD